MASIFNALHIGYTGLNAAQVGINTTGHNIANAETDGFTRQRVVATTTTPIASNPGQVGNGVEIQTIKRVFDNFVFDRYTQTYSDKEYSDFEKQTLEQLSTYFPEIDEVGIKADLQEYYNMWQSFSDNPDNDAIKLALTKQTEIISNHIHSTRTQVAELQNQLNNQIEVNVNEVNSLAKKLADLNRSIDTAEAGKLYDANDLRDQRNIIERDMARLIGANTNYGQIESNTQIHSSSNTITGSYSMDINGFNIVDGSTYHPLRVSNDKNPSGFYELSYERQDGILIPMEEIISGGKIGALLDLRGGTLDTTSGVPKDGILQNTIAQLDGFAKGLIESTNNIYASSVTTRMDSNAIMFDPNDALMSSTLNVNAGTFNVAIYDIDGNEVSSRSITIDVATRMTGLSGSNSIQGQMEASLDDNADGNANNDIDDYIDFNWGTFASGENVLAFSMDPLKESQGYTFAIKDSLVDDKLGSGTNFAGALGMNRFFDGYDASSIDIHASFKANPTGIKAGYSSVAGDNRVALDMIQQQFEDLNFKVGPVTYEASVYGMFDIIATEVGTVTNSAITRQETISTQFNAVEMEYFSVSKVSIDEEMTNLIKYQTSYGAAAKVITTIDQMMQTLLGIKQ